jgi:2-polyprenyl-6-methoxyphenol hydroxylase-like FAD-dependent oxidoreductase
VVGGLGFSGHSGEHGALIDGVCWVRRGGAPLVDLSYAQLDARLHGLGIHRGVLFETLFSAARAVATIHCGVAIAASRVAPDGRWLADQHGERHGPFALVIAADGAASALHGERPGVRSRLYPWGALWFVASDAGGALSASRTLHQTVDGADRMVGLLPTGHAPGGERAVVSLFWSLHGERVAAWRAAGLAAWRDQVLRLDPRAEAVLDQLDDLEPVLFTRYRDVAMWPWHADRLVFLGDAAHATSPQLGQGANLALVDAAVLADTLADAPTLELALARYSALRRRHLAYYQFATRALTPLFQGDSRLLGWLRDRAFPASRWIRPLRHRMVLMMTGVERGVVRRPMPLAELTNLLA